MADLDGAQQVARSLARNGVELAFMLHGGHIDSTYQACHEQGIRMLSVRHESAGGHAAEGYARAGRRLGVMLVTTGAGVTNVVTSMANAHLDRTPVLYLAGAVSAAEDQLNALHGLDQLALAQPVTKWAQRISAVEEIPRQLTQAIRIATTPPTGPVFVEIPSDALEATIAESRAAVPEGIVVGSPLSHPLEDIDQAIALLRAAERPAIMAGGDVYSTGAWEELRTFSAATSLPVFAQYEALGTVSCDDPLYVGTLWQLSQLPRELQPDLVLALGVRFGWHAPGFRTLVDTEIIHVEVDANEFGRPRPPRLSILAGCREALRALNDRVGSVAPFPDRSAWATEVRGVIGGAIEEAATRRAAAGPHPYRVAKAVLDAVGPDAIIVGDGAFSKHWLDDAIAVTRPGSYFTHGSLGTMGIGLGLAMGVRLANPDRPVVCITGDGSVGFHLAELESMVRHDIPVLIVVMNNRSQGNPVFPTRSGEPYPTVGIELSGASYADVAAGLGGFGRTVGQLDALAAALTEGLASGLPACIDVLLEPGFEPSFTMGALRTE